MRRTSYSLVFIFVFLMGVPLLLHAEPTLLNPPSLRPAPRIRVQPVDKTQDHKNDEQENSDDGVEDQPSSDTQEAIVPLQAKTHSSMQGLPNFAQIVERVAPAVVSIRVVEEEDIAANPFFDMPGFGSFRNSLLERFFREFDTREADKRYKHKAYAQGSGFIVSKDGYVVTNNHVVQKAQDITVVFKDGLEVKAKRVGSDDKTDLALLKVNHKMPLPFVEFDREEDIKVGDWVLAMGNPFGLGGTVTTGIVSARGRNIGAGPYDDFIQISAPINSGNSGGPTFDLQGRVVGVNTAIISPSGGSVGIGFAIPSSIAAKVVEELKTHGSVRRGWLGVIVQNIDPDMSELFHFTAPQGALITRVEANSPAYQAGLKPGDVILSVDQKSIQKKEDLSRVVADLIPQKTTKVMYWRAYKQYEADIRVQELTENRRIGRIQDEGGRNVAFINTTAVLGLNVAQLQNAIKVFSIQPGSRAEEKGIFPDDVILKVCDEPVYSIDQIEAILTRAKRHKEKFVKFYMGRGNITNYYVALPIVDENS